MRRRILVAALAALPLAAACTPQEIQRWRAWHAADPAAAEAFADDVAAERAAPTPEPQAAQAEEADAPPAEPAGGVWDRLAECESGGDWNISTGNGYYGGLQFSKGSWEAVGGTGYPHEHSRAEQISRAERLLDIQGWGAWPSCSRQIGLR
jgi:Transglycosylase-like domain